VTCRVNLYPIAPLANVDAANKHHQGSTTDGKRIAVSLTEYVGGQTMQIINLMTSDPVTTHPQDNLSRAKSIMEVGGFRRVPVVDDGRLVGILTERDLQKHSGFLESTRVNAAMRTALITITPHNTVEDAARLMLQHKIGGLPIVAAGRLVGIVTTTDLLKAFLNVVEATSAIMER
jgi:acetoin utilization protein AcuB